MDLNASQAKAVSHRGGGLLVLAGAGTGKTRVLTHRVADLARSGVPPERILAVTFTNKAAREMRRRTAALGVPDGAWIATFHAIGLRILRRHADLVGYTRKFSVYDDDAQVTLIKSLWVDLPARTKEVLTPRAIVGHISYAKDCGLEPDQLADTPVPDEFLGDVRHVFEKYQEALRAADAMDFADLLGNTVKILRKAEETEAAWLLRRFAHVLVDEFQDTNRLQMEMADLLATNGQICVVGDDDQCLAKGTMITMGDGSRKPIEQVREGDAVLSCYGSGDYRPAVVTSTVARTYQGYMVEVTTRAGRTVLCTPDHTWFAGYRIGVSPQKHVVYLMYRRGVGWRIGTSRIYTENAKFVMGFAHRALQERADAQWILSTHEYESDARHDEYVFSLKYGIHTLPFVPRAGSRGGLVHDADLLKNAFAAHDAQEGALRLLDDMGLSIDHPHHRPRSRNSNRRNVTVTLCGDRRGATPMHRISIAGNDDLGRQKLEELGFSVRDTKRASRSWRVETCYKDFADIKHALTELQRHFDINVVLNARFGCNNGEKIVRNSLPFLPAESMTPGMVVFAEDGSYDVVEHVRGLSRIEEVYDLNVGTTHNFVANGIVAHNCLYSWRGADPMGIVRFSGREGVEVVRLEDNYRSTQPILDCANTLIARNAVRLGKTLRTTRGGPPVRVTRLKSEREESEHVAARAAEPWESNAVLYRTHAQSRALEEAFRRRGVPYKIIGGWKFYDRLEIKDLLAYFRLALNPRSDVDILRIANRPARGIGPKRLEALRAEAARKQVSIFDVLEWSDDEGLAPLRDAVVEIGRCADEPLDRFYERVLEITGYRRALEDTVQKSRSIERREEATSKIENVDELGGDLASWSKEHRSTKLEDYVEHVALVSSFDDEADSAVSLMTIHAAKGLEFPRVFLVGFEDGLLPHASSLRAVKDSGDQGYIEEERRLAYVAITRAMDRLEITLASTRQARNSIVTCTPSQFLDELPQTSVEMKGFKGIRRA